MQSVLISMTRQLDPDTRELLQAPPEEQERRIEQILGQSQDPGRRFRSQVCGAYDNRCAITGLRIINGGGSRRRKQHTFGPCRREVRTWCRTELRFQGRFTGCLTGI